MKLNLTFIMLGTVLLLSSCAERNVPATHNHEIPDLKSDYVKVIKSDGICWLITPAGTTVARGVCCVMPQDYSAKPGSPHYDALSKFGGDINKWTGETAQRLKTWNFNVVGAWSSDAICAADTGLFHTRVIWYGGYGSSKDMRLTDVFSEEFAGKIEETGLKEVAPFAEDRNLIGFFINNELPWYGDFGWPTSNNSSLLARYMELPGSTPGKQKLCSFLHEYYNGDFSELHKDWILDAQDFRQLPAVSKISPRREKSKLSSAKWAGIVAEKYFSLCEANLRKNAPHHLILGCRFAGKPPRQVMEACGRHSDIISINMYRKNGDFDEKLTRAIYELTSKPVWISEFSWRASENSSGCPNTKGAEVLVETQEERALCYEKYVSHAFSLPFVVACDWFQYFDQSPAGRSFDGENSNYGLLDINDKTYQILVETAEKVNGEAEMRHANGSKNILPYDPEILADFKPIRIQNPGNETLKHFTLADSSSKPDLWGDKSAGYEIREHKDNAGLSFDVDAGKGWGAGLSFAPEKSAPCNKDGSGNFKGITKIIVQCKADPAIRFSMGLNESGHAPPGAQTYQGENSADGESYQSCGTLTGTGSTQEYIFNLEDFSINEYYGNQRGNRTIDTDAIAQIQFYFPASPGTNHGKFVVKNIIFE